MSKNQTRESGQMLDLSEDCEQLPHEHMRAYHAAQTYFALGAKRSLKLVAQQVGVSKTTIENYSSRYQWVRRAQAYDNFISSMRRRACEDAHAICEVPSIHAGTGEGPLTGEVPSTSSGTGEGPLTGEVSSIHAGTGEKWAARLEEQRELQWHMSQLLLARVREMLAVPLHELRWTPRDVATYFNLAMQLIEQAATEAIEETQTLTQSELKIQVEYVDGNDAGMNDEH